jgi:tetratricopeptide (TPR) repeat protein
MSETEKFIASHSLDESIQHLNELTTAAPEQHELWKTLAGLFEQKGDLNKAKAALQQYDMIKAFNDNLYVVGRHIDSNKLALADQLCRQLLTQIPGEIRTLRLMAIIAKAAGRSDIAVAILSDCYNAKPGDSNIAFEYIKALNNDKQYQSALALINTYPPSSAEYLKLLSEKALAEIKTGSYSEAASSYQQLLDSHPNKALCLLRLGNVQKILGHTSDAISSFQQAITLEPSLGEAYWNLANTKTYKFSADEIAQMKTQLAQPVDNKQNIALLNFALGKALEDEALYAQSFDYYQQGNALCKARQTSKLGENIDAIKQLYGNDFFSKQTGSGHSSDEVIFIIGLPRSGSTLVEQILASHSLVDGTMELNKIPAIANDLSRAQNNAAGKPLLPLASMSKKELKVLAQSYLDFAAPLRQDGLYFIDKLPANFLHVGLIKVLFPKAKIIDVRRDPMACGWSIYKQFFAGGVSYAYDLQDIAEHYNHYTELMEHWHKVLPGQILTVNYESLINDFEATVGQIVKFCGLTMEPSCLNFHENKRPVATPSAEQVRQPIYKEAIDHWRHYESFLAPLVNNLKGLN